MSGTTYWVIALVIGLAAALIVDRPPDRAAALGRQHREVGRRPARRSPTSVAGNTANIPQLEATAPVLAQIVDEAVVQDGYMNALTDGFGDSNGN